MADIRPVKKVSYSPVILISLASLLHLFVINCAYYLIKSEYVGIVGLFPVILIALLYGLKFGLIAALVIDICTGLSFYFVFPLIFSINLSTTAALFGIPLHFVLAAVIGSFRNLIKRLHKEIDIRKKTEAELRDYRKKLEDIIQERNKELDKAYKHLQQAEKMEALSQLTGGIVHDFNNMLSGIIGFADLIKMRYLGTDDKLENYINAIFDTSVRAAKLISKLLVFSRKAEINAEIVNIHDLIQNVLMILKHSLDKRIQIITDLQARQYRVMGDSSQLQNFTDR